MHRVHDYLTEWFNEQFSGGFGEECALIYESFAQLTNVCKVEHLYRDAFSQLSYGDEAARRLHLLADLHARASRVHDALPAAEQDAFFELLGMKVSASYFINASFYFADRSRLAFRQGKMQCADDYTRLSRLFLGCKRQLLYFYNEVMAEGKWRGILTPEAFPPPASCIYPDARPALFVGEPQMGVLLWNEEQETATPVLTFDGRGTKQKWLEIFNKGAGSFAFTIENNCPFLTLSQTQGRVQGEVRILLSLTGTPQKGSLVIRSERGEQDTVTILPAPDLYFTFSAAQMRVFPEGSFCAVPALDRMSGPCMEARQPGARLAYTFTQPQDGDCLIELNRYLTLNSTGSIRLRVTLDGREQLLESFATDEWRQGWFEAVRNNGEKLRCTFPQLTAGEHTLTVEALEKYLTLGTISLYFGGSFKPSQLGPAPFGKEGDERLPLPDEDALLADTQRRFGVAEKDVPPLKLTFAGHGYWNYDRLYLPNEEREQSFAPPRYPFIAGAKKEIIPLFGSGVFEEQGGILALEAEYALEGSKCAFQTADERGVRWRHLIAETDGGTGLAMVVEEPALFWEQGGPALHFRCRFTGGKYYVWLLLRFDDPSSDACAVGIDGEMQPRAKQYGGGAFFTYSSQFLWVWTLLSELDIAEGSTLSRWRRSNRASASTASSSPRAKSSRPTTSTSPPPPAVKKMSKFYFIP